MLTRRQLLSTGLAGVAISAAFPVSAWAAATVNHRFLFIIQRGAADGLATLAPTGDPDFVRVRAGHAAESATGAKLDSLFTLHPKMAEAAKLFSAGQARFVHAMASGYRERSHFDGQNILESGAKQPYGRDDGWLNRLATLVPTDESKALAVAPSIPLVLRGNAPVTTYAPSRFSDSDDDLIQRVSSLYSVDPALAPLWESALETRGMAGTGGAAIAKGGEVGKMIAGLMAGSSGARIVAMETNGWDTHSQQNARLGRQLGELDAMISAIRTGLGADWNNTLVLVATEFGRTVAFNGTQGTDHGTASAAMLFGGKLSGGGKVQADWPGLSQASLYESRDLKPTARFETVASEALAQHYSMDAAKVRRTLFPDFA